MSLSGLTHRQSRGSCDRTFRLTCACPRGLRTPVLFLRGLAPRWSRGYVSNLTAVVQRRARWIWVIISRQVRHMMI